MSPLGVLRGLLAAGGLLLATSGPVHAQSPVQRPGVAPTHAADFGGIWISFDLMSPSGDPDRRDALVRYRELPPYKPDWEAKARAAWDKSNRGEKVFDATSDCIPPGLAMWYLFLYPTELLMTPGQIVVSSEYFNQTRRIFTDGRGHPPADEIEPTFLGHSIGRWEGSTLVVDTVGIRNDLISEFRPHSDRLHITERLRLLGDNRLEWNVTMDDPTAFAKPFERPIRLQRAPASDSIREYVCQEHANEDTYAPSGAGKPSQ